MRVFVVFWSSGLGDAQLIRKLNAVRRMMWAVGGAHRRV